MAVGELLPHCDGTGTQADPYIFTTPEGFKEAIAVNNAYVEAGEPNLVFDSAKDNIPKCVFNSRQFDGKNLTIRNMVSSATNDKLVELSDSNGSSHIVDIRNTNFTNIMSVFPNVSSYWRWIFSNVYDYTAYIRNCNFSGIVRGAMPYTSSIIHNDQNYQYLNISDCSFNINLDVTRRGERSTLFYLGSSWSEMSNTTVCLSGTLRDNLSIFNWFVLKNCTLMNKPTNPLKIDHTSGSVTLEIDSREAHQNYVKLYIEKVGNATPVLDLMNSSRSAKILVNKTRLGASSNVVNGGIVMYEDESEGADKYIYSATNLNAKGFTVGEDVE